jgi:Protein of unknown function (DUF1592)/Protein of unknown function (DUF1588)/Protein of unknown function (DUF1595)/Protein of unknown function (DUF1585)/Protein of unknown function (DUF1587)
VGDDLRACLPPASSSVLLVVNRNRKSASLLARLTLFAAASALAACAGQVSGTTGNGPGGAGTTGAATGAGGTSTQQMTGTAGTAAPPVSGPSSLLSLPGGSAAPARLHKLTTVEFTNSVRDLLGSGAPLSTVEPDDVSSGFATVGASLVSISPSGVSQYEDATGAATDYAFSDATRAAALLACVPTGPTDKACFSQALAAFGRRAFRRPLTDAETTRYVTLATTIAGQAGSSAMAGLRHAVWAILQSPSFMYRVELGVASAGDGGRLKYTDYEVASRLAGALWSSVPDDALLDAAAQGKLATADGVRAQATRMLADARVHRSLAAFVDDLMGARELAEATKDPAVFPAWTNAIRDDLQRELEQRIDDMVFTQKGDYLSLLESRTTFVNNELAAYYGLPKVTPDAWHAVTLPADSSRVGLLGAGAILAGFALPQRTSPTARGRFVAASLLCRQVPDPPPGIPPLPAMAAAGSTLRQRLTTHRSAASCSVCHALMDPMGFGMETFDSAGMPRTTDNGQPIDATGTLDGTAFDGLATLGTAIHKEAVAGPCLVSKLYTYGQGRALSAQDAPALDGLATRFAQGGNHVDQLLLDLVSGDSFRFVTPGTQ